MLQITSRSTHNVDSSHPSLVSVLTRRCMTFAPAFWTALYRYGRGQKVALSNRVTPAIFPPRTQRRAKLGIFNFKTGWLKDGWVIPGPLGKILQKFIRNFSSTLLTNKPTNWLKHIYKPSLREVNNALLGTHYARSPNIRHTICFPLTDISWVARPWNNQTAETPVAVLA